MKLEKLPNERKVELCRKYFLAGFAFLPFLWAVNAIWFMKEAFWRPPYEGQKSIKKYVTVSGIGALVWLVGIISWIIVFQQKRSEWGELGDKLSFVIPKGVP